MWSSKKKCKKLYYKSATKLYQVCISIVYESFILVLALHCYCGDNVKYGLLSKHLLQRKQQYDG